MTHGPGYTEAMPSFDEVLRKDPAVREYISRPWQERLPQWNRNCLQETEDATKKEIAVFRSLGSDC